MGPGIRCAGDTLFCPAKPGVCGVAKPLAAARGSPAAAHVWPCHDHRGLLSRPPCRPLPACTDGAAAPKAIHEVWIVSEFCNLGPLLTAIERGAFLSQPFVARSGPNLVAILQASRSACP